MSEENVEIVRSFYRAWTRGDLPGPVELMDSEIEYVNPIRAVGAGNPTRPHRVQQSGRKSLRRVGNLGD